METYEVVAPVKSGLSYAFEVVSSFEEIELDYPTTITSLKKYYLPPRETLLEFDATTNEVLPYAETIKPRVIFRGSCVRHQRAQLPEQRFRGRPLSRSVLRGAQKPPRWSSASAACPRRGAFATCSTATRPEAATICFFKTSASATSCPSEASRRPTSSRRRAIRARRPTRTASRSAR